MYLKSKIEIIDNKIAFLSGVLSRSEQENEIIKELETIHNELIIERDTLIDLSETSESARSKQLTIKLVESIITKIQESIIDDTDLAKKYMKAICTEPSNEFSVKGYWVMEKMIELQYWETERNFLAGS